MTTRLLPSLLRRTTAASVAVLLGVALSACGGSDDEGGPAARVTQTVTETATSPESASTSAAPTEPTTSATQAPADLPSEAELEAALLTTADVPDGFTVSPDDGPDDDGGFAGTCLADVGRFEDAFGAEPDEEAEVELASETPTGQAAVTSKVEAYADAAKLASVFATFTDTLQSCTSVEATEEGVTYALDIAYDDTVDLPGADDQLAFAVTGTIGSGDQTYPVSYRFVVALAGPFVSVVGAYTIGDDSSGVVDTTADLAAVQAERVAGLA
ncbi:hypothetical protein [Nocardioides plantarum]|uniref:PknH-like extracellular domain-containing protein n=1 Tax=Nocardioides plantarum TaxID=29299 RepID=A0ABV5KCE8_9ACTN|nr:hypothetical protein [Nocardioides plantarum]